MLICQKTPGCTKLDRHGGACEKRRVTAKPYTPTIEEGERAYIDGLSGTSRTTVESATEYRRMIAEVERAAAARTLEEAADAALEVLNDGSLVELAAKYGGYYSGVREGGKREVERLRARAAEIRGGAAPVTEEGDKE